MKTEVKIEVVFDCVYATIEMPENQLQKVMKN